jgi:eukaryotic-like serine/threonine-protein kinase
VIGETLGSYRITRAIGEGGMGTVYLAEHTLIGRHAAIKVLRPELCHRAELVSRFFNEARAAGAVQHPCIVEIFDFGRRPDGSAFIVMELLHGEPLGIRLRRVQRMPEAHTASLVRQMCGGLAAAHAKGIIHRDIKPDNVFLLPDPFAVSGERVKILDFGIAKLAADQLDSSMRTRTGTVLGTPAYMAPEQCKGTGEVDHRADLYSLGCILYAMVCGRPPFVSDGMGELMAKHIYEPVPPPSALAPVSPALEHVILRALAKDPNARFASADELAAALEVASPSGIHPAAAGMANAPRPVPALPTPAGPAMTTISATPATPAGLTTPATPAGLTTTRATPAGLTTPATPAPASSPLPMQTPLPLHTPSPVLTPSPLQTPSPLLTPAPASPGRARGWLLVAGAGLAGLVVYLTVAHTPAAPAVVRGPADEVAGRAPAVPAAAPAPSPAAAHAGPIVELDVERTEPEVKPPDAAAPADVTLRIVSIPPGAHVYGMPARARLGITPVEITRPAAEGEVLFLLERSGYRSEKIALPGDRDGEREVHLRARTRPPRGHTREPQPLHPGNTLNPFEP